MAGHPTRADPFKIGEIIKNINYPIILKGVCEWSVLRWTIDNWVKHISTDELPFRCNPPNSHGEKQIWERDCPVKMMTMKKFLEKSNLNDTDWYYFDYKYIKQWFGSDSTFFKEIKWDSFGFPDRDATESTIWIGSKGAHTPCHQDSYGLNIVVQVFGRKRWMLFPPETGGMKSTRVPYEESSVYSQLNFNCPVDLKSFEGVHGCRLVTLEPGEALIVPPKWWHYVENVTPVAISINSWIPCDIDAESRVEEALTRFLVAQICKDLPASKIPLILNPNEDDLPDMPLTVSLLQVDSTVSKYIEYNSKKKGAKRLKVDNSKDDDNNQSVKILDIDLLIDELKDYVVKIEEINKSEFINVLKGNLVRCKRQNSRSEDESNSQSDHLTSAIINSFCHPSVIKIVKDNLIHHFQ